jgi:hypothetical protein
MDENVSSKAKFYEIESRTRKGLKHIVRVMPDGEIRCDCERFVLAGKECYHIDYVKTHYLRK